MPRPRKICAICYEMNTQQVPAQAQCVMPDCGRWVCAKHQKTMRGLAVCSYCYANMMPELRKEERMVNQWQL